YDARPVKLAPSSARDMPAGDAAGTTWTFHLKPGMFFSDDPAFKGRKREVTAEDYVYSIKRLYDPSLKSPWLFMFEDKLAGDEAYKNGKFDYAKNIEGLQAVDKYTLRIKLKAPDPSFLFYMALPATGAVAREVAEAYGLQMGNHPVGSGPFSVEEWKRSDKITLAANPDYQQRYQGRKLPQVDKVEVK